MVRREEGSLSVRYFPPRAAPLDPAVGGLSAAASMQSSLIGRHNTRKRQIAAHSEGARTLHCSASPGGPTDTAASRRTAPGSHTAIKREAVFTLTDREWACSQRTFSAFQRTLRFQFSPGAAPLEPALGRPHGRCPWDFGGFYTSLAAKWGNSTFGQEPLDR